MQPNRRHPRLLTAVLLFSSVGCAPKVYTSIQKSYPARTDIETVLIYDTIPPPPAAEQLGTLHIASSALTVQCDSMRILERAKNAVLKTGGNGLHITGHRAPSEWVNGCHEIKGDILYLSDSLYQEEYRNNQLRLLEVWKTNVQLTKEQTQRQEYEAAEDAKNDIPARNAIFANAGAAIVISNLNQLPEMSGSLRHGYILNAGFNRTGRKGFGGGILYSRYASSARISQSTLHANIHYFAAEFAIARRHPGSRWILSGGTGLGYALYTEKIAAEKGNYHGFGVHLRIGGEYRITPHIGIGAETGFFWASFIDMSPLWVKDGSMSPSYITLNGGLRFYF